MTLLKQIESRERVNPLLVYESKHEKALSSNIYLLRYAFGCDVLLICQIIVRDWRPQTSIYPYMML